MHLHPDCTTTGLVPTASRCALRPQTARVCVTTGISLCNRPLARRRWSRRVSYRWRPSLPAVEFPGFDQRRATASRRGSTLSRRGRAVISCCMRSAADRVRSSVSRAATASRISAGVGDRVQRATHPEGLDSVRVVHLVGARRVLFRLVGGTGHAARDAVCNRTDRYVLKRRNSRLRPSEPR
jgi:hypothetical protein